MGRFLWNKMKSYILIFLLGLNSYGVSSKCIGSAADFATELKNILANWSLTPSAVCTGARISTRTQVYPTTWTDPESLSKFGNFWVFGTGPKVITEWLQFAKDARGNKTAFTQKVMFHIGADKVDFTQKFHMVAYNLNLMDGIWVEDDGGQTSILATWDNIFNYFASGFKVCKASSGTVSGPKDCTDKTINIATDLRQKIKSNSFEQLTGCKYGYPDNSLPHSDADECETRCGVGSNTATVKKYCQFYNEFKPEAGSIECVQQLITKLGATTTLEADKPLILRGFFEHCMAFYPWFTGRGVGYDPDEEKLTGEEFLVRGDVHINRLEYDFVNIYP